MKQLVCKCGEYLGIKEDNELTLEENVLLDRELINDDDVIICPNCLRVIPLERLL